MYTLWLLCIGVCDKEMAPVAKAERRYCSDGSLLREDSETFAAPSSLQPMPQKTL